MKIFDIKNKLDVFRISLLLSLIYIGNEIYSAIIVSTEFILIISSFLLNKIYKYKNIPKWIYLFIISLIFIVILNTYRIGFVLLYNLLLVIISLYWGYKLSRGYKNCSKCIFYILLAHIGYLIFLLQAGNYSVDYGFQDQNTDVSTNGYIFIANILYFYIFIYKSYDSKYLYIALSFIVFLISVLAVGRSGIIVSLFFFIFTIFHYSQKILFLILAIVTALGYLFFDNLIVEIFESTRLIHGLASDDRELMRSEYYQSLSIANAFIGASYFDSPSIVDHNFNPHNSYIRAHFLFGFAYLFFLFMMSIKTLFFSKNCLVFNLMFFLILIRAFFDTVLFPSIYDCIIISYLFMFFNPSITNNN